MAYLWYNEESFKEAEPVKISTKGRYSLRMLVDLAEHRYDGFVSLKDISERQDISKKYLEQLVTLLNRSDILRTNRGNKGGYMLAKEPGEYTVGQILRITEGDLSPVKCLDDGRYQCKRSEFCKTLPVWRELDKVIQQYLDSVTLQDILDNFKDADAGNYHI